MMKKRKKSFSKILNKNKRHIFNLYIFYNIKLCVKN